jgi:GntR family transcriptional regulator, arabinose operon transcriptional repressor
MPAPRPGRVPKYRQVYTALQHDIRNGRWKKGDRLPSEADLVHRFRASRITVGRAVRDLQLAGFVERRAGSGTYVTTARQAGGLSFGLLIPDLGETEIFEPMCQGMMTSPLARAHALVWGSVDGSRESKPERAWHLCAQYLERRVSGVFFAPLELAPGQDTINQRIVRALDAARIPIVLLDRDVLPYPDRSAHDLVGIDNRRAGFIVTDHLVRLGARRVAFIARPLAAATVAAREAGYREALIARGVTHETALAARLDPGDAVAVRAFMKARRPDAVVCANDRTAGQLMQTLLRLGYAIPGDVRMIGIDDVEYAALLPVPLSTLRQPTRQIGEVALGAMLDRAARFDLPPREVLLPCELVVRASCGAESAGASS